MKQWHVLRTLISVMLFGIALFFESAHPERLLRTVLLFSGFLFWMNFRLYTKKTGHYYIGDVVFLLLLEHQSRYLINYIFHILWFFLLIEICFSSQRRTINSLGIMVAGAGLYKFAVALFYHQNARTVSELLFNIGAFTFILVLANYNVMYKAQQLLSNRLSEVLLDANQELRDYADKVKLATTLSERTRIAREIHDTLGYHLTSLIMELEVCKSRAQAPELNVLLQGATSSARQAMRETRRAVKALSQPPEADNEEIINMVQDFAGKNGIEAITDLADIKLPPVENLVLFRIIQESLTNAVRHGKASKIVINSHHGQGLFSLSISDNGTGGEVKPGFGLQNMAERVKELGGNLEIASTKPFTIKAWWQTGGAVNEDQSVDS